MDQKKDIFSKITNRTIPKWKDLPEIDLYMDQVIALMEKYLYTSTNEETKFITPSMINNYVKLGIMPAPIKKKYSREHLAYLIIICSLKQAISIPNIKLMIDKKLEKNTISQILDAYSDLYDVAFKTITETCKNHINSDKPISDVVEDTSIFTAIIASNCIDISNKLLCVNE